MLPSQPDQTSFQACKLAVSLLFPVHCYLFLLYPITSLHPTFHLMEVFSSRLKRQQSYRGIARRHAWTPGLSQIPLLSTAALLISAVSIVFSAVVLAVSDGKTLHDWASHWTFTPTVYLSIASTITNITLHYALSDGLDVSWWRQSLRSDTNVGDLHRAWAYGNSFFDALLSFRHVNLIAVACVIVTLTPFNGPLLQRASHVRTRDSPIALQLEVSVADQLPKNYTGYVNGRGDWPSLFTSNFTAVVRDYYQQAPIRLKSGCLTNCKADILGAGWAVECQSSAYPYNMTEAQLENPNGWAQIFGSDFQWTSDSPVIVQVGAQIKNTRGCLGNLLVRNCTLVAATVRYAVELTSNTASLANGTTMWDDTVIGPLVNGSWSEENGFYDADGKTTYGGMARALHNRFGSYMLSLYEGTVHSGSGGYQSYGEGESATAYVNNNQPQPDCDVTFDDPMDDMIAGARELMFRTAVSAGSLNSSYRQSISATATGAQNVYKSQYLFLGLATMLSGLGILFVTMTFNGFWQLGRRVTLSPIETAKAFNAPLLSNNDSNAPMRSLLDELGMRPVRYGAVVADISSPKRRKGSKSLPGEPQTLPNTIIPTSTDFEYSDEIPDDEARSSEQVQNQVEKKAGGLLRLAFADPEVTQPPVVGAHYVGS